MKVTQLSEIQSQTSSHGNYLAKEIIEEGEYANIHSFGQVWMEKDQMAKMHGHDGKMEVFFVLKGSAKIVFGDGTEVTANSGTSIITESDETHEVSNPFDEPLEMLYFTLKA